jgi:hypothetical protein
MNAKFNLAYGKVADYQSGRISAADLSIDLISLIWIDALLSSIVLDNWPDDDDDEKKTALNWMWWGAKQPLNMLLLGRDATSALDGFESNGGPIGAFWNTGRRLNTQLQQGEADFAAARAGINFTGLLFGLPSSQINRFVSIGERVSQGKDISYIDFIRQRKPEER